MNQDATLAAGGTLSITDRDVMPHQLIEVSGPAPVVSGTRMNHMGAAGTVTFAKPGHDTFTTKAGEDYMKGVQTVGADHVLTLSVTVVGPDSEVVRPRAGPRGSGSAMKPPADRRDAATTLGRRGHGHPRRRNGGGI